MQRFRIFSSARPLFTTTSPLTTTTIRRTLRVTAVSSNPSHLPGTSPLQSSIDPPANSSSARSSSTSHDPPSNQPGTPTRPASETTGRDAAPAENESSSSPGGSSDGDARHPAKQPDTQEEPTRSTGIGNQGAVSSDDKAGGQGRKEVHDEQKVP